MSKLSNFNNQKISLNEASDLKGGLFCEWYISQRTAQGKEIKQKHMNKAMRLDALIAKKGLDVAMQRGANFMSRFED
jgi:hypothetical protein